MRTCLYALLLCLFVTQSCLTLAAPRATAHQAPPSMDFSRQEYWSGLPFPSPGDLLDQGIKDPGIGSPAQQADTLLSNDTHKLLKATSSVRSSLPSYMLVHQKHEPVEGKLGQAAVIKIKLIVWPAKQEAMG